MTPERPSDPLRHRLPPGPLFPSGLAWTDEGPEGGPAYLFVHGMPGSHRDFRWLAPTLPGCRLLRVDLPGFGASPAGPTPLDERGRAAVLRPILDAAGVERVVVVGHSIGGAVASAFAEMAPERVHALGLLASAGARAHLAFSLCPFRLLRFGYDQPPLRSLAARLTRRLYTAFGFPRSMPAAELETTVRSALLADFRAHGARMRALRIPTLVAWSEDDRVVERSVSRGLAALSPPGPRLAFPTGGHNIQKTQAVELGAALRTLWG